MTGYSLPAADVVRLRSLVRCQAELAALSSMAERARLWAEVNNARREIDKFYAPAPA